jgi:hypothetical protein
MILVFCTTNWWRRASAGIFFQYKLIVFMNAERNAESWKRYIIVPFSKDLRSA